MCNRHKTNWSSHSVTNQTSKDLQVGLAPHQLESPPAPSPGHRPLPPFFAVDIRSPACCPASDWRETPLHHPLATVMTFSTDHGPAPPSPDATARPIFSFYTGTGLGWLDHSSTWVNKHIHNVLKSNVTISRPNEHLIFQFWKKLSLSLYYSIIDVSELNNFHNIKSIKISWNLNCEYCVMFTPLELFRTVKDGSWVRICWTLPWPAAHPPATSQPPRQRNTFKGLGWFHTLRKLDWVVRAGAGIAFNL